MIIPATASLPFETYVANSRKPKADSTVDSTRDIIHLDDFTLESTGKRLRMCLPRLMKRKADFEEEQRQKRVHLEQERRENRLIAVSYTHLTLPTKRIV